MCRTGRINGHDKAKENVPCRITDTISGVDSRPTNLSPPKMEEIYGPRVRGDQWAYPPTT